MQEAILVRFSQDPISIQIKVGGRLALFVLRWKEITQDQWVLETVEGYRIDFVETPAQVKPPSLLRFSKEMEELVTEEIQALLEKGAIERARRVKGGFISNIFLVEKKREGHEASDQFE